MQNWTRRGVIAASLAGATAACTRNTVKSGAEIDAEVAASRQMLYSSVDGARNLADRAQAVLIIPRIIEGGFVFSGAYGEGALQVGDATVDYISVAAAAVGLQIGGQIYSQALFFMTPQALGDFRATDGWQLGVDAEVAALSDGVGVGASTNTVGRPVIEIIYGQRGLIVGASLEGAKYNRLIR